MQNFEFLRKNRIFERVQSLFTMKSLFYKNLLCLYKSFSVYFLTTKMVPDTPAKILMHGREEWVLV